MSALALIVCVAALFVLIPLPAQIQKRNIAAVSLIVWLVIADVCELVNSVLWYNSIEYKLSTWCDISTKLQIGAASALASSTLCLSKQVELIASDRGVTFSRRGRQLIELSLCIGLPIILMALHFVAQQGRFDIVENIGCISSTASTVPALIIVWLPPLLLYLAAALYIILAFRHFAQYRASFAIHIHTFDSKLTVRTYLCLSALVVSQTAWGILSTVALLIYSITSNLHPWLGWTHVHPDFTLVSIYTFSVLSSSTVSRLLLSWWRPPISAYLLFICLTFAEDTFNVYKLTFCWLFEKIGVRSPSLSSNDLVASKGPPDCLIIHKTSTIDIKSDADNDRIVLSNYTSTSELTLMSQSDKGKGRFCSRTLNEPPLPSPQSFASTSASHPRILISDEFPPSRPATPPFHQPATAEPAHRKPGNPRVPTSPPYHRPFSPPTIYRTPGRSPNESALPGVQVTIHVQTDEMV